MKVYIAGKITGDPDYAAKFQKWSRELEKYGCIILNPSTLPEGMTPADYMRICFSMIDVADRVAFLPGWEDSGGAKLEYDYSEYIGKEIFLFDKDDEKRMGCLREPTEV